MLNKSPMSLLKSQIKLCYPVSCSFLSQDDHWRQEWDGAQCVLCQVVGVLGNLSSSTGRWQMGTLTTDRLVRQLTICRTLVFCTAKAENIGVYGGEQ